MNSVTSNAAAGAIEALRLGVKNKELSSEGWYKVCSTDIYTNGFSVTMYISSQYNYITSCSHCISIVYGWLNAHIAEVCNDAGTVFDKLMITYEENQVNNIFIHYRTNNYNKVNVKVIGGISGAYASEVNFVPADVSGFTEYKIINLGTDGFYVDGTKVA